MDSVRLQRGLISYYNIDITTMKKFVKEYLRCRQNGRFCGSNHLYLGPPGIGKSETIVDAAKEIADELGLEFWEYENASPPPSNNSFVLVMFRLDMVKPEDLSGFPVPDKSSGTFDYAIPRWAKVLKESRGGLVVLDEFTNVNDDTLLSAAYDIVLSEKVNLFKFGKPVIALGNPPEVSSLARPLPLPLLNRLAVFEVRSPEVEEWCNYMDRKFEVWAKEVCAFLHAFSDLFLKVPEDVEDLTPFPTPRSWTSLALALANTYSSLYESLKERNPKAKKELVSLASAYVGPEAAHTFVNWAYTSIPSIEDIIKNPRMVLKFSDDQLLLTVQALAHYKHPHWKARVSKVLEVLLQDSKKTRYAAMLLRFMDEKKRKEFVNYLKKNNARVLYEIRTRIGGGELFGTR